MKSHRLAFIDILRGLAIVWMIETHVLNAFLAVRWRTGAWYELLNLSNGFVAVAFVFCAGAGFWLGAERGRFNPRRWGFILVLGYWLNLPSLSLMHVIRASQQELGFWLVCDILQLIALSCFVAYALFGIMRLRGIKWFSIALVPALFFATPFVWSSGFADGWPQILKGLIVRPPVSKFPFFPWMGYFFAGVALTAFFSAAKDKARFAAILVAVGLIVSRLALHLGNTSESDWWYSSPGHAIYRLSWIIAIFAALFLVETRWGMSHAVGRFFQLCGQESLFIYMAHTLMIYGSVLNKGLIFYAAEAFSPLGFVILTLLILVLSVVLAHIWRHYKMTSPREARLAIAVVCVLFLVLFAVVPP